jgi:hypothetical protein
LDAVLYADDDEDDDADFRFTVMVKEAEIVAELADLRFAQRFCKILRGGLRRVGSRTNLLRIAAVGERVIRPRQARDRGVAGADGGVRRMLGNPNPRLTLTPTRTRTES